MSHYAEAKMFSSLRKTGMTADLKIVADGSPLGDEPISSLLRTMPPMYAVLRSGSTSTEIFRANSDDEAATIMRRQVREGRTPAVFLYKLIKAEFFVPSSESLDLGEIQERFSQSSPNYSGDLPSK